MSAERLPRVVARLPWIAAQLNRDCRRAVAAFDRVVAPILGSVVEDSSRRTDLDEQLRGWAVKGACLVFAYGRLSQTQPDDDLTILAAVFTRVYDDLLDEPLSGPSVCLDVAVRLGELFAGGSPAPATEIEAVLFRVFHAIEGHVPRTNALSYRALCALHRRQCQSLQQVASTATDDQLLRLTRAKGGLGMVVLATLVTPAPSRSQVRAVYSLGAFLQLLDDFEDRGDDQLAGVATAATRGVLTSTRLWRELAGVKRLLQTAFDRSAAAGMVDQLWLFTFVVVAVTAVRRHQPASRAAIRPTPRFPARTMLAHRRVLR